MEDREFDFEKARRTYEANNDSNTPAVSAPKQIITFWIEGEEIKNDTEKLKLHSKYFRDTLKDIPQSHVKIILPEWANIFSLTVFLKFVNEDMLPKFMEPKDVLKVLWISDYFKVNELIEIWIKEFIIPQLSKKNIIMFIEEAYSKLKSKDNDEEVATIWYELLDKCINFAAYQCPSEILYKKEARALQTSIIEEIIERSFKHSKADKPDISLINLLLEERKWKNIFSLLKFEEKKITTRDAKLQFEDGPALTWELSNFTDNYYKESEPFVIDGFPFMLTIQYLSDVLQLRISTLDLRTLKKSKKNSPIYQEIYNSYTNNDEKIISAMYKLEINGYKPQKVNLVTIFDDGESFGELANIPNFDFENYIDSKKTLKVELYFRVKHTHAAIMTQIAKNYNFYHTDKSIKVLEPHHLALFFKFDYLEVMSEDQVLISFVNWFTQTEGEHQTGVFSGILDNIRWNHVTFKTLHKVISQNQEVKQNQDMKRIFKNELERRIRELLQDRDSSDMYGAYLQRREPRKSYINFLRPETTTFLFDFIWNKLLEVDETGGEHRLEENKINDATPMDSFDQSITHDNVIRQSNVVPAQDESQSKITRNRYRDKRKVPLNYKDVAQVPEVTPRKTIDNNVNAGEEDDLSSDNDMETMLHKLTPMTDKRQEKNQKLFDDNSIQNTQN